MRPLLVVTALVALSSNLAAQAAPAQTAPRDSTFRITPLRPVEELRREALLQTPPPQPDSLRASDLVDLVSLDPTIKLDIRYATTNNFMGAPMYSSARAFLQLRPPKRCGGHTARSPRRAMAC